jgi:predicted N-formylglutamate amidohydrolase
MSYRLLAPDEPGAVLEERRDARSEFVIIVDHAGARIPRRLGDLGLSGPELARHIAWDIGALEVARRVAAALDGTLVAQNYSRLVIDCNRDPACAASITTLSEHTQIPGNVGIGAQERAARRREIFDPYHEHIRALLDARERAGRATILVAQHSMTNLFKGVARPMHAAVLYNRDRRLAAHMLDSLRRESGLVIGDNEPYAVNDETDYSVRWHGEARALAHVELEIRQDLILDAAGQNEWGERIARALRCARQALRESAQPDPGGRPKA